MRYSKIKLITRDKIKYKLQFLDKIPMIEVMNDSNINLILSIYYFLCVYTSQKNSLKKS